MFAANLKSMKYEKAKVNKSNKYSKWPKKIDNYLRE